MALDKPLMVPQPSSPSQKLNEIEHKSPFSLPLKNSLSSLSKSNLDFPPESALTASRTEAGEITI